MGKAKRAQKRARREARGTEREQDFIAAERERERRARRRRQVLVAIPVLTFGLAAASFFGIEDPRAAGVVLLVGGIVFLLYALGSLGSQVQARDRHRAGSIDFGRRR